VGSQAAEFTIDTWQQFNKGLLIAARPVMQEARGFLDRSFLHVTSLLDQAASLEKRNFRGVAVSQSK
jgi:hypothetical protein